jgi:VWFA-related protein
MASLSVAAAVLLSPARAHQQQAPVFKSGVDLVALDVTVVDKDGKPIEGLKVTDFVVTLNGKPGTVRQMDYLTYGAAPSSEVTVASRETSNAAPTAAQASRGGRVIVLLIDDLAAKPGQGKGLLIAAERILNTLDLGDLVGLATTSGLGPAVSPTRDRAAVLATLKSRGVVGRNEDLTIPFFVTVPEALQIERGMPPDTFKWVHLRECGTLDESDPCSAQLRAAARRLARDTVHRAAMQLRAYADIVSALKPAPAPRVVIALSTGVAPGADDDFDRLQPVSRAAAEAGVQFYAMTEVADPIDLSIMGGAPVNLPPQFSHRGARQEENAFLTSGVQVVAAAAGGEAWRVVGQADRFFRRIISETSGVYRLGVETTANVATARFLDAKVSVKRSGVTVRAHRHAIVPTANVAPVPVDEALRTRIASGGVAFGVPIALATSLRRDPAAGGGLQLGVNIQMPANVAAPLVAMFAVVDQAGKIVNAGRQPVPSAMAGEDYQLAFPIGVAPGAYRLRFAVADAAGNIGSVEQSVDARLPKLGSVTVSDLVITWIDADGKRRFLALETVPAAAASMRAFLELYRESSGIAPAIEVRFAVFKAGESAAVLEETRTPLPEGTALAAGIDILVGTLGSGDYTLRATVVEAGVETGTVTTSFRKQ